MFWRPNLVARHFEDGSRFQQKENAGLKLLFFVDFRTKYGDIVSHRMHNVWAIIPSPNGPPAAGNYSIVRGLRCSSLETIR